MNKYFSLILAAGLLVSLSSCDKEPRQEPTPKPEPTPVVPVNPDKPQEGEQPESKAFEATDFKAEMLQDGVLTLPEHFTSITAGSLEAQKAQIKRVVAPGVTEIADGAFADWQMLTSITFSRATKVGDRAFSGCNAITSVELPEVLEVCDESFAYCAALKTLSLPKLNKVGNKAFVQCHNLTKVELPEIIEIGMEAFAHSINLAELHLPKLRKLQDKAFAHLYKLRKVTLGENMPEIAEGAKPFEYTSVAKALYVPANAEANYTDWAGKTYFLSLNGDADKITNNHGMLPEGLKVQDNSLSRKDEHEYDEENTIPNFVLKRDVMTIKEGTFDYLTNTDENRLEGYFLAAGIQKIESGAFQAQDKLEFIELPSANNIATGVFSGCSALQTAVLPSLTHLQSTTFEGSGLTYIDLSSAKRIEANAFENCAQLKYIVLGNEVPQTPDMNDPNDRLKDSIFGRTSGSNPVQNAQVTIVVPDGAEAKFATFASKYTQIKEVIPVSKFRK